MAWTGIKELLDLRTISHRRQRYDTSGDYFKRGPQWFFRISRMKDKRYCWLVLCHEFIEWCLCQLHSIKQKDIDRFDLAYEARRNHKRTPCGCKYREDPGDDIHAPYYQEHRVATQCEQIIAKALDVEWDKYEQAVDQL